VTPTPVPSPSATGTARAPLPTTQPSVVRIQFAPGATSATLTGRIVRKEEGGVEFGTEYLLRAFAGQTMAVAITSPGNDVLLTIVGADGVPLKRYVDGEAEWRGQLHATQDYSIIPTSVGSTTDYALAVSVSALRLSEPTRIQFDLGATGATVEGDLTPGLIVRYVLRALRGQRLEAHVAPASSISLAVEGQDESLWSGSAEDGRMEIGSLPAAQDYVITLALVPTAGTTHYSLSVTVVAGSGG
jgi:hypothetical protein